MKRFLSMLLVFFISIGFFVLIRPVHAEPVLDPQGIDPWASIYHDSQNTGFTTGNIKMPLKEGFTLERESSTGFFASGPAIYNNVMYLSTMTDGRGRKGAVVAYDISATDPEELWRAEFDGLLFATPTLDIENKRIFVETTSGYGQKKDGVSCTVYCISLEDGSEIWNSKVDGASFCPVSYFDGKAFISTFWVIPEANKLGSNAFDQADGEGVFYCLDAETGEQKWSAPLDGGSNLPSIAAAADGVVYIAHGNLWADTKTGFLVPALKNSALYAFDIEGGTQLWKYSAGENSGFAGSPSVEDGKVYIVMSYGSITTTLTNALACLDAKTGTENWKYETAGFSNNANPILTSESVLFASNDANLNAVNKETGKKQWSKKLSDTPSYINIEFAAAATDGFAFASGLNFDSTGRPKGFRIQAFDLGAKGKSVYKEDLEADSLTNISVYGKNVFFGGQINIKNYQSESPELAVSPDKVDLGKVERSTKKDIKISVKNNGIPGLQGKVAVSETWMKVNATDITDDTKEVIVTIDTTGLQLIDYNGKINFTSNGGNKTINVMMKIIDTTAPIITWDYTTLIKLGDDYYTKEKQYKLKGSSEPTAKIIIQDKPVEIDAEGKFEIVVDLVEGKNDISVETADDVPNTSKTTFTIYLDTKAPIITLSTENYAIVQESSSYIMGQIDDKEAVLTINDEPVQLTPTGSFAKIVTINKGENKFVIKAVDKVGNETVQELIIVNPEKKLIILVVGKKEAEVNGDIIKMDVAPLIIKGSTMVPLRSLGDFIGATVNYEPKEQKITFTLFGKVIELFIGRTTAKVNGEPVKLQVPPTIISGRTLVPLRFVSENLGAKVDYEAKTRTITITYPAPVAK